ncbi:hypothetical protein ABU952_18815 [Bacillus amyloliquefaciens]|uniref:hypothetical protein n=1 Tax=Bacillus amyloliquefaciens TaxID=1390 RepID=UPI00336B8181
MTDNDFSFWTSIDRLNEKEFKSFIAEMKKEKADTANLLALCFIKALLIISKSQKAYPP